LCHPSLAAPPLSRRAAHLSLHHRLSLRHSSLEPAGCYIAASLIMPLATPRARPRGMIRLGGGGCDETMRGAASAKKHGSCENVVWIGLDLVQNWTACLDMPSRFFDLDPGVPRSGLDLDQIWTKSGPNLESSKNRLDQFWQPPIVWLQCNTISDTTSPWKHSIKQQFQFGIYWLETILTMVFSILGFSDK
jgi:hypothetical protein